MDDEQAAPPTPHVLIVDDDRATTETFARMLALEGYQVRTAADAEIGLRELDALRADAIILDLRMPFINGLGFLYRLRERPHYRHTPVVLLTGDTLKDTELEEIQGLGAELHFKPIWLDDLVGLVRGMVGAGR